MYKYPVFSPFHNASDQDSNQQKINKDNFTIIPSSEAGFFDTINQSYDVARFDINGRETKPTGEGIDYVYPNPPEIYGIIGHQFWGLSGQNYCYYQSGIFLDRNDDIILSNLECLLDYYYSSNDACKKSLGSGLFHYNGLSNKFSGQYFKRYTDQKLARCWDGYTNLPGNFQYYKENPYTTFNKAYIYSQESNILFPLSESQDKISTYKIDYLGDYKVTYIDPEYEYKTASKDCDYSFWEELIVKLI